MHVPIGIRSSGACSEAKTVPSSTLSAAAIVSPSFPRSYKDSRATSELVGRQIVIEPELKTTSPQCHRGHNAGKIIESIRFTS